MSTAFSDQFDNEYSPKPNRGPLLVVLVLVGVLGVSGAAIGLAVVANRLLAPIELPTQTSPDGTWTVKFVGKPVWSGAIEIEGTSYDIPSGTSRGPYVVGLANSAEEFRQQYSTIVFQGNEAFCNGKRVMFRPGTQR